MKEATGEVSGVVVTIVIVAALLGLGTWLFAGEDAPARQCIQDIFEENQLEKINDDLYLTRKQMDILKRNDIEYSNKTIDELMFEIEDILNDEDNEELDRLSMDLAEFNYYHNTNK